jgi:hypothetical protein
MGTIEYLIEKPGAVSTINRMEGRPISCYHTRQIFQNAAKLCPPNHRARVFSGEVGPVSRNTPFTALNGILNFQIVPSLVKICSQDRAKTISDFIKEHGAIRLIEAVLSDLFHETCNQMNALCIFTILKEMEMERLDPHTEEEDLFNDPPLKVSEGCIGLQKKIGPITMAGSEMDTTFILNININNRTALCYTVRSRTDWERDKFLVGVFEGRVLCELLT